MQTVDIEKIEKKIVNYQGEALPPKSEVNGIPVATELTETNTDFEVRSLDAICLNESHLTHKWYYNLKYLVVGWIFGIIFVKAEIISWFRIQEMFRLQSFHMYGIIGSAVLVGAVSVALIKKFNIKTIYGEKIEFHPKKFNKGQIFGGLLFGIGWAMTGACPGPLFAQVGTGATVIVVTLLSAIAGTWIYGLLREKLPH
ncbi:MAG: YeeE/YedE thiosulfate transporter family protein [Bacteroidia bacterium]|nr:YeeE/YedE family protein [Bacteroidia bacterium]MDW8158206.1 YeeE/YedE thiosulfate transporter family protein [Bacteroidia bacterium]